MKNKNTDHTPGPWGYTPSPKGGYNIRYGDNVALARVLPTFHPKANAALIAAAPELLDAARLGLEFALAYNRITGKPGLRRKDDIEKIAAAITKAKGE